MSNKNKHNALAVALGTGFAVTLAASSMVNATENPFAATEYTNGYMVAAHHGEGEGSCGEKGGEGSCGEKGGEGSCGEKGGEGSCGEKTEKEGKCGEGKCGS